MISWLSKSAHVSHARFALQSVGAIRVLITHNWYFTIFTCTVILWSRCWSISDGHGITSALCLQRSATYKIRSSFVYSFSNAITCNLPASRFFTFSGRSWNQSITSPEESLWIVRTYQFCIDLSRMWTYSEVDNSLHKIKKTFVTNPSSNTGMMHHACFLIHLRYIKHMKSCLQSGTNDT